jgi:hypothetical protein
VCFHRSTPPDGTNPQMALIYRGSPRKIARKAAANQLQSWRCNSCLIRSGKFGIFIVAQKSLIPRVKLSSSNWQLELAARKLPMPLGVRSGPGPGAGAGAGAGVGSSQGQGGGRVQGGRPSASMLGPSLGACPPRPCLGSASLIRASSLGPMAWCWGPWHGEGYTLRWIYLSSCRPAQPGLSLLGRALLGRAARKKAASGRTGPGVNRSGSETNGADGPGFCSLIPLF